MKNEINGKKSENKKNQIDINFEEDKKTSKITSITADMSGNKGNIVNNQIIKHEDNSHKKRLITIIVISAIVIFLLLIVYFFIPLYKVTPNNFDIYPIREETESIKSIGEENIIGKKPFLATTCHRYTSNNIKINKSTWYSFTNIEKVTYVVIGYIDNVPLELSTGVLSTNLILIFTTSYYYYDFNELEIQFTVTYSNNKNDVIIFDKIDVDQDVG